MTNSPATAGMPDPERSMVDSSKKAVFASGLCQSLKNVNQYKAGMIEKIKKQLGNHSICFREKQQAEDCRHLLDKQDD